jgi:hypothetical protein
MAVNQDKEEEEEEEREDEEEEDEENRWKEQNRPSWIFHDLG